jgi:hypothetical protein
MLSMDARGSAPRPSAVREIANLLLESREKPRLLWSVDFPTRLKYESAPSLVGRGLESNSVDENWVTKYVKRRPELTSRFSRRYNYERAKCEDPKIIGEWFTLV